MRIDGSGNEVHPVGQEMAGCPEVLTGMSHEMRTQMNAIVAFSFLMNREEYSMTDREEFSNQILQSCEQLIELFDNFLDSAIIDTGNSKVDSGISKPESFFEEILSEFREILRKEKYKDLLLVTENQILNPEEIVIDTNKVTRVIRNLFQNSLTDTKSGYIKIGYDISNGHFNFHILDSGMGYFKSREFFESKDLRESLAKFNDVSSAVNIFLIRKLIHLLGGTIRLECNGLTGTGIYFSIPVQTRDNNEILNKKSIKTMITI